MPVIFQLEEFSATLLGPPSDFSTSIPGPDSNWNCKISLRFKYSNLSNNLYK